MHEKNCEGLTFLKKHHFNWHNIAKPNKWYSEAFIYSFNTTFTATNYDIISGLGGIPNLLSKNNITL